MLAIYFSNVNGGQLLTQHSGVSCADFPGLERQDGSILVNSKQCLRIELGHSTPETDSVTSLVALGCFLRN